MALVWRFNSDSWQPFDLADRYPLDRWAADPDGTPDRGPAACAPPVDDGSILVRSIGDGPARWVLLEGAHAVGRLRVNGRPLAAGLRVLRDRDVIRMPGTGAVFFSTERLAEVTCLPAELTGIFCARCKADITPRSAAVLCPRCSTWHHQTDEHPCWSYAATCAVCDQPTAAETGYAWTPEHL